MPELAPPTELLMCSGHMVFSSKMATCSVLHVTEIFVHVSDLELDRVTDRYVCCEWDSVDGGGLLPGWGPVLVSS